MKVLFACDGSKCSDRATEYLIKSLRVQVKDLDVTLFHVCVPMLDRVAVALGAARVAQIHREDAGEALKSAHRRLQRAGIVFDQAFTAGNAPYCISKKAAKGKYDLVLMGSHGRSALKNILLGSVTARVLSECTIPVLVVH